MNPQKNTIDERERIRKSLDRIKVFNPFDVDRTVVWDGFHHPIYAHGEAILERFLAEKYLEETSKWIITSEADAAIKAENKRRIEHGMAIMDKTRKTGEQYEFETPFYANWTARFKDVIKEYGLYGGVVQEYGMEYIPQVQQRGNEIVGSLIDQLEVADVPSRVVMPAFDSREASDYPNKTPLAPLEAKPNPVPTGQLIDSLMDKGVFELSKIARDKGLTVDKKMSKQELIKAITA